MEENKENIIKAEPEIKDIRKIKIIDESVIISEEDAVNHLIMQKKSVENKINSSSEKLKLIEKKQYEIVKKIEEDLTKELEDERKRQQAKQREANNIIIEGKNFFRQKQYEKAIEVWERASLIDPSNTEVRGFIAEAEQMIINVREEKEREKELKEELDKEKREKLNLGRMYYRENQYQKAIEVWDEILRVEGENPEILALIAKAEDRIKEVNDELVRARREKEERERSVKKHLIEGRRNFRQQYYEKAIEVWENIYAIDPDNKTVSEEIRRAEKLLQEKKEKTKKEIGESKEKFYSLQIMSMQSERDKNYETAIKCWEEISVYGDYHDRAIQEIKRLEEKLKLKQEHEKKEEIRKKDIEKREREKKELQEFQIDIENRKLFYDGQNFFRAMKHEKAIQEWEKILVNDPLRDDIKELIKLASENIKESMLTTREREEKLTSAKEQFQKLIIESQKALVFGNYDEAFNYAEAAGELNIDDEKVVSLFVQIKKEKNRVFKEKIQYEMEQEERNKNFQHLLNESDILIREGKYREAMPLLERASLYHPEDMSVKEKIGHVQVFISDIREEKEKIKNNTSQCEMEIFKAIQKNEFEKAEEENLKILSFGPNSPAIKERYQVLQRKISETKRAFEENERKNKQDEREVYLSAFQAVEKDEWERGLIHVEKLLLLNPKHDEGMRLKNFIHEALVSKKENDKRKIEREEHYKRSLIKSENEARAFIRDHLYNEAIDSYVTLLEQFPEHTEVFNKISHIESLELERQQKLLEREIKEKEKERHSHMEEAEYNKQLRLREKELLIQGIKFYENNEYASAIRVFEELLLDFPTSEKAQHYLSRSREAIERTRREQREQQEREQNKEREARRLYYEGRKAFREGNFELALEYFEKTAELTGINQKLSEEIHRAELKIKEEKTQFLKQRDHQEELRDKINKLDLASKKFFREGDYLKAIANWEDVLTIVPDHPSARMAIEEAEKKLESLHEEKKKKEKEKNEKIMQHTIAGIRALAENNFSVAMEHFQKILLVDPENEDAKKNLDKAFKLKEEHEEQELERKKISIEENQKKESTVASLQFDLKNKIENLNELALKFFEDNEFHRAIAEWKKIRILSPESRWVDEEIRKSSLKIKEHQIHIMQEKELSEQKKLKIRSLWVDGRRHLRNDDYEEALECFENILLLDRGNREVLAEIRFGEQKLKEQRAAIIRKENERQLVMKKLSALVHQGNKFYYGEKFQKAIETWEEALTLEPDNRDLREAILKAEEKLYVKKEKEKIITEENIKKERETNLREMKTQREVEKSSQIRNILKKGRTHLRDGKYDQALSVFEEALNIDPYSTEARESLREAEHEYVEWKRTLKQYEEREIEKNKEREYIEVIGDEKFAIGEYKQALDGWKKALKLDPQRKELINKIEEVERILKEMAEEEKKKKAEPVLKELEFIKAEEEKQRGKEIKIEKIFEKGRELFEKAEYLKAAGIWKEVLFIDNNNDFIKEEIRKAEKLVEEQRKEEKNQKELLEKRKEEEILKLEQEKKREHEAQIGRLKIEALHSIQNGDIHRSIVNYEKILELSPEDKDAQKSLDELQKYMIEMEKERRQSKEHLAEDLEFILKQKDKRSSEWKMIKKEIAEIKNELKKVYKSAKKFLQVQEYDRAIKDIEIALNLAGKYKIRNMTTVFLKRLYNKILSEHELELNLKAKIMAASSNISKEEALEKLKEEKNTN